MAIVALRDCCVAMLSRRIMPLSVPRQKASRKIPLIVRACNCRKHSDIAVRCGEHSKGQCRPSGDFDAWICEGGCAGPTSLARTSELSHACCARSCVRATLHKHSLPLWTGGPARQSTCFPSAAPKHLASMGNQRSVEVELFAGLERPLR